VFEARGEDARFFGVEGGVQWEPVRRLVLDGTASWVRGTRVDGDDPLPAIPPLNGGFRVRYDRSTTFVTLGWDAAAPQRRVPQAVPDPFGAGDPIFPERTTGGYGLLNAGAGLRWSEGPRFHTLTLSVDNLTDAVWRDHLSRIKDVAPQPGRNVQLLYRVQF
jgi:iron complex outermembrane recepter protein